MSSNKISRSYGVERNYGDVIYNTKTKTVTANIEIGVFGRLPLILLKRADGGFDLIKAYKNRNGEDKTVNLGRTFPAKSKDGQEVEGITKGTLGLVKFYDDNEKKEKTSNHDALFFTTHKLKENKAIDKDGEFMKIGYIKGRIGIEIDSSSEENYEEVEIPY